MKGDSLAKGVAVRTPAGLGVVRDFWYGHPLDDDRTVQVVLDDGDVVSLPESEVVIANGPYR